MFLGFLWNAIKEIKAPFMCDVQHGIALHAVQGNRASSRGEGEVSWFFSSCGGNLGYILELRRGWPFHPRVSSATSGLLPSCEGQLGMLLEAWQAIVMPLQLRRETKGPFPRATEILGLLSTFTRSQASSPLEALISAYLWSFQRM